MASTLTNRIAAFEANIAKSEDSQSGSFLSNAASGRSASPPRRTRPASPSRTASPVGRRAPRRNSLSDLVPSGSGSNGSSSMGRNDAPPLNDSAGEPSSPGASPPHVDKEYSEPGENGTVTSNTTHTSSASSSTNPAPSPRPSSPLRAPRGNVVGARVNMFNKSDPLPSGSSCIWNAFPKQQPGRAPRRNSLSGFVPNSKMSSDSTPEKNGGEELVATVPTPPTPEAAGPVSKRAPRRNSLSNFVPAKESSSSSPATVEKQAANDKPAVNDKPTVNENGEGDLAYWREEAKKLKAEADERKQRKAEKKAQRAKAKKEREAKRADKPKNTKAVSIEKKTQGEVAAEPATSGSSRQDPQGISVSDHGPAKRNMAAPTKRPTTSHPAASAAPRQLSHPAVSAAPRQRAVRRKSLSDFVPTEPRPTLVIGESKSDNMLDYVRKPKPARRRNSLSGCAPAAKQNQAAKAAPPPRNAAAGATKAQVKAAIHIQSTMRMIIQRYKYRQMLIDKMYEDSDDGGNELTSTSLRPGVTRGMSFNNPDDESGARGKASSARQKGMSFRTCDSVDEEEEEDSDSSPGSDDEEKDDSSTDSSSSDSSSSSSSDDDDDDLNGSPRKNTKKLALMSKYTFVFNR